MATYAIGDVHGCYDQLQQLLKLVKFNPQHDTVWFTGDLINGGPKSLETLRFLKSLGDRCVCILGNHDIALLAIASGHYSPPKDRIIGFEPVLEAPDSAELLDWLRQQRLAHYDPKFNALIVHAGVLPSWDLHTIQALAHEVENTLRTPDINLNFDKIFGDTDYKWDESLTGFERIKYAVNCFTRMRFCSLDGRLEFLSKGEIETAPTGYIPWFEAPDRLTKEINVIFGHWSMLKGNTGVDNVYAIDTGCVWGERLTALRLEDKAKFSVPGIRHE